LILVYVMVAAAISTPVMATLLAWLGSSGKSPIPPLTLPFNIVTLMCLMGLHMVRYSAMPDSVGADLDQPVGQVNAAIRDAETAEALDFSVLLVFQIVFRGLSQLFLVENEYVGVVV